MALRVLLLALPFRCETENLETKVAISSPIIKFGGRFLAQIVENRKTRLSSLFLGHWDHFLAKLWQFRSDRETTESGNLGDQVMNALPQIFESFFF